MNSRYIRVASVVVALALGSSCSKVQQGGERQQNQSSDTTTPDIAPSAAPGVAFNFDYQFSLPDKQIAAAQEAHASACERLGLAHCRITGMTYNIDQDEQVTAELELKLDPSIARAFGKSAQQVVESSDGKLVRLQIGSSDEGATIEQASKRQKDASGQAAELREELAKSKPGSQARANLLSQLQSLEQQGAEQTHAIEASQAALATTPMAFRYYGRGGVPGFRGNPLMEAWQTFITTVVWLVGIILQALAVLVPLLVLVAAIIGLWRTRPMRVVRGWIKGPQEVEI